MSRDATADWRAELARHRQAVAEAVTTGRAFEEARWHAPLGDGKWSPAQVCEHLRLTYVAALKGLEGGGGMRVRTSRWQAFLLRLLVLPRILRTGRFPKGVVAPREIRPADGPYPQQPTLDGLQAEAERFLALADGVDPRTHPGLDHPFFGRLPALQNLRILTAHTRMHHRQMLGQT